MFNKKTDHPRGSKKLIGAWTLYDWSNSVYSLVISSAVFPIYYSQYVFSQTNSIILFNAEINKDSLISLVSAFSFLLIAFLSPLLSGIADYIGNKKIFMKFFVYLGSLSCIGLYWFGLIFWGSVFNAIANNYELTLNPILWYTCGLFLGSVAKIRGTWLWKV